MAVISNNKLDEYGRTLNHCKCNCSVTITWYSYTPTNIACQPTCKCWATKCLYEWEVYPWALGYASSSTCCGTTTNVYSFCDVVLCDDLVQKYDK